MESWRFGCAALAAGLWLHVAAVAGEETGGSYLMGAMGDSISAGTLADGHAHAPPADDRDALLYSRGLTQPNWIPFVGHMQNKATLSWASGTKIASHYLRLKQYVEERLSGSVSVMNTAVPGEKTIGMIQQAEELQSAMESGNFNSLKYVTFLIGANDACQGTDDAEMATQLKATFDKLAEIRQPEKIRILVSAIPRIPELGRPEIVQMRTVANLTCGRLRDKMLKECPSLTVWKTTDEYAQRVAIVERKNAIIEKSARDAAAAHPELDIAFSRTLYDTRIQPAFLAADCFHPDEAGHELLASELWKDHPWFK